MGYITSTFEFKNEFQRHLYSLYQSTNKIYVCIDNIYLYKKLRKILTICTFVHERRFWTYDDLHKSRLS